MTADELNETAFPEIACLLDLLAEHPKVAAEGTLYGAVETIKRRVIAAWEASESLTETAEQTSSRADENLLKTLGSDLSTPHPPEQVCATAAKTSEQLRPRTRG